MALILDGEDAEEENAKASQCAIPHAAADTIRVRKGRRGQERCRPCPGGHNPRADETRFHRPGRRAEFLRALGGVWRETTLEVCKPEPAAGVISWYRHLYRFQLTS